MRVKKKKRLKRKLKAMAAEIFSFALDVIAAALASLIAEIICEMIFR